MKMKQIKNRKKRQQIIDDLRLFQTWNAKKWNTKKITSLLDTTFDNVPKIISKQWIEAND